MMRHIARFLKVIAVALGFLLGPVMGQMPSDPAPSIDFGSLARAVQPDEVLADPSLENRARHISAGLRCLVCQNQSIDDSDAPLAKDLRVLVRERLGAGDSDRDVTDYIVARYGEFVLLTPRLSLKTVLLWATPIGLLAAGAIFAFASARRRVDRPQVAALSVDEERAVARALEERGL